MIWPRHTLAPAITISPWSWESLGAEPAIDITSPGSAVWPAANRAILIPFRPSSRYLARRMFVHNGATVSGNIDLGIYNDDGTLLVSSGSTAQAGVSVMQYVDITDTWLAPGAYYLALAVDNTTATVFRGLASVMVGRIAGMLQATTAFPLPARPTLETVASAYLPVIGVTSRTV